MSAISNDLGERRAFIERTVEHTQAALREPAVSRYLGRTATQFIDCLSTSVVADVEEGKICLPQMYDEEALPITAIRPDEVVTMSREFDRQTPKQRERTMRKLSDWEPDKAVAINIYEDFIEAPHKSEGPLISFQDVTTAMTGMHVRLAGSKELSNVFSNAPNEGLALFKLRPALILGMFPGTKHAEPDVVAHELIHVQQIKKTPVEVFRSQRSVDMAMLRIELEAYHVGSLLTAQVIQKKGKNFITGKADSHRYVQMMVEITRQKHGIDQLDPYRPSPLLLRKLAAKGLDTILHGSFDYDQFFQLVENFNSSLAGDRLIGQ